MSEGHQPRAKLAMLLSKFGRLASGLSYTTAPLVVPGLSIIFAIAFWRSVSPLGFEASVIPRVLIVGILCLAASAVVEESLNAWRIFKKNSPSVGMAGLGLNQNPENNYSIWQGLMPWITIVCASAFVWAMPRVGFYESAIFFSGVLGYILGFRPITRVIVFAVVSATLLWLLFSVFFGLLLPRGFITQFV